MLAVIVFFGIEQKTPSEKTMDCDSKQSLAPDKFCVHNNTQISKSFEPLLENHAVFIFKII